MSKIMTITMISNKAMKKVIMNFLMMYLSIFFRTGSIFLKSRAYSLYRTILPRREIPRLDVGAGLTD